MAVLALALSFVVPMMAVLPLLLLLAGVSAKPMRPASPTNVTVFGLRPYELSQPLLAINCTATFNQLG